MSDPSPNSVLERIQRYTKALRPGDPHISPGDRFIIQLENSDNRLTVRVVDVGASAGKPIAFVASENELDAAGVLDEWGPGPSKPLPSICEEKGVKSRPCQLEELELPPDAFDPIPQDELSWSNFEWEDS